MILSKKANNKGAESLYGCAGWSAPLLFANPRRQVFSRRGPDNNACTQVSLDSPECLKVCKQNKTAQCLEQVGGVFNTIEQ